MHLWRFVCVRGKYLFVWSAVSYEIYKCIGIGSCDFFYLSAPISTHAGRNPALMAMFHE